MGEMREGQIGLQRTARQLNMQYVIMFYSVVGCVLPLQVAALRHPKFFCPLFILPIAQQCHLSDDVLVFLLIRHPLPFSFVGNKSINLKKKKKKKKEREKATNNRQKRRPIVFSRKLVNKQTVRTPRANRSLEQSMCRMKTTCHLDKRSSFLQRLREIEIDTRLEKYDQ